ncbi:reverse transcriptase-like protein [Janthinobacterium sp.]|uniref:reverse transcriptase-like protein n=1 Tax=Janthinobacterium sp. TaxID=1871054 RepID=UPI00293D8C6B|nr:reverse transcriptase-like protein [Janthinobacterium sp.]
MPTFDTLNDAAHQGEKVLARRLARSAGIGEPEALRLTLEKAAGAAGLPALLAARAAARLADAARRGAKSRAQSDKLAAKRAAGAPPASAWLAWFDGSAHPNPGRIGIGALLTGPAGERVAISRRAGHGSSSEAEYSALIALLEAAAQAQADELVVYGDSRVVIDDVNGATAAAATLAPQRERARALLAQLPRASLRWIPRHKNGAADQLSQRGVALADSADREWDAGEASEVGEAAA